MNQRPLVSVLMTVFNRENYIAQAIESVLVSTYPDFELIIVDDCSTDKSFEIAKTFAEKDPRIKLYMNEKNLGDYANRNQASYYATGDYLMSIDSDDMALHDGIERCVNAMEENPSVSIGMYWPFGKQDNFVLQTEEAIHKHFFEKSFLIIGPGGTIIRRKFFEEIGRYPVKYGPANDMYFNLKAACRSAVLLLPFEFIFYRRHEGQQINNKYSYLINNYNYLNDALDELPLPLSLKQKDWLRKKNKRRFVMNITGFFLKKRNLSKTKEAIKQADFKFTDAIEGLFHF